MRAARLLAVQLLMGEVKGSYAGLTMLHTYVQHIQEALNFSYRSDRRCHPAPLAGDERVQEL